MLERAGISRPYATDHTLGDIFTYEYGSEETIRATRECKLYRSKKGRPTLFISKADHEFIVSTEDKFDCWFCLDQVATLLGMSERTLTSKLIREGNTATITFARGRIRSSLRRVEHRENVLYNPEDVLDLVSIVERFGVDQEIVERLEGAEQIVPHMDKKKGVIRLTETVIEVEPAYQRYLSGVLDDFEPTGKTIMLNIDIYGLAVPFVSTSEGTIVSADGAALIKAYICFANGRSESDRIFGQILRRAAEGKRLNEVELGVLWIARSLYMARPFDSKPGERAWYKILSEFTSDVQKGTADKTKLDRLLLKLYEKGVPERFYDSSVPATQLESSGDMLG